MSEITEVKTSIKKISSIFNDIKNTNADHIPKLEKFPPKLTELIKNFEEMKVNNIKKIESNTDEIYTLKDNISHNKRDIQNLEEGI